MGLDTEAAAMLFVATDTGEHGIGPAQARLAGDALDPAGILNPGKVIAVEPGTVGDGSSRRGVGAS